MFTKPKDSNTMSMSPEKLIEQSKYLISRYDGYHNQVNVKSNFLLIFNTFLCTSILVVYEKVFKDILPGYTKAIFVICLIGMFLTAIVAIGIIMRSAFPFLKSNSNDGRSSLIFFGSIASRSFKDFECDYNNQSPNSLLDDYKSQVHVLATGLAEKYRNLRRASFCIFLEVILIFIAFIMFILNHIQYETV